jgi:nitroimidazol reductase NimA-like FMN-containing flavoprotein (pyridoxamine 5'-phosphate oxidase superfamily)
VGPFAPAGRPDETAKVGCVASLPEAASARAELVELTRGECLDLLATGSIGRVIVTEGALPAAHPVTYLLDGEEIVFRTGSASKLAAATRHQVVGFQVDHVDPRTHTGWSVLGVGQADEIVDPTRLSDLADRLPTHWAPDGAVDILTIPLQRLTGRWLAPPG